MKRQFFDEGKLTQTGRLGVILIVGVLCILAGMGLLNIIDDHAANKKKNAELAQKIEIALLRLSKELHSIQSISAASDKTITYVGGGEEGPKAVVLSPEDL